MSGLSEAYARRSPAFRRAKIRLQSILEEVVASIEDKTLVRAEVTAIRIKELSSLKRKAEKNSWNETDALARCGDLIGGRVVCNNIEDVYRFAELLKDRLPSHWGNFEVQDYVRTPNEGGYRALHVNFRLDVGEHPFNSDLVACEVQIRTRLQDAWAELSHEDIYKQPGLPEHLRTRANDLAEILATADKIASDIRLRAQREIIPPHDRPELTTVSIEGLAFVFREVFGRSPPDYIVRLGLDLCNKLHVTSLERLPEVLLRAEFRDSLNQSYRSIVGVPIQPADIFLAAIYAVARNDREATKWVRRKARREWEEIEQVGRREALSSLPETIDELLQELEDPRGEADVEGWAEALGATTNCAICGTTIIKPYSFAESAVEHYQVPEEAAANVHERIETAVSRSSAETGGWGDGSLCAYHNERAAKDD